MIHFKRQIMALECLKIIKRDKAILGLICLVLLYIFLTFGKPKYLGDKVGEYDKNLPIIWVGGVPRSGTTLMRSMLDAHEDIRCGEETHVIPQILASHRRLLMSARQLARLKEAGVSRHVILTAMASYILNVITLHGEPASRLCNKDPFTLASLDVILEMFPNSKFLFMIRDGRATAHSIISRRVGISGFDTKTYRGCLRDWNRAISHMHVKCANATEARCLPVYYEELVLHPRAQMARILAFLGVGWSERVLHHEEYVGKKGGVSLSSKEASTGQVLKPINLDALTAWAEFIPEDVRKDIGKIAPMLQILGYNHDMYPPDYGTPDEEVVANSIKVKKGRAKEGPTNKEREKHKMEESLRHNPYALLEHRVPKKPRGRGGRGGNLKRWGRKEKQQLLSEQKADEKLYDFTEPKTENVLSQEKGHKLRMIKNKHRLEDKTSQDDQASSTTDDLEET